MPTAHPTLVVGVGAGLAPLLDSVARLLAVYEPRLAPITHLGVVADGRLRPVGNGSPQPDQTLEADLRAGLEGVVDADALLAVRGRGLEVGGPGGTLQFVRVLLVVDPAAPEAELRATLEALRAETARAGLALPARLTSVLLATGADRGALPYPLDAWLAEAQGPRLVPVNLVVLDRWRADGSVVNHEAVRQVLPVALLVALLPAEGGGWLFRTPAAAEGLPRQSVGVGVLRVPVPELLHALRHGLTADLLALALGPPRQGVDPERWVDQRELETAFSEAGLWRFAFTDVDADADPSPDAPFAVRLHRGRLQLDLARRPWARWADRIADYDVRWGTVHAARWRTALHRRAGERLDDLRQRLDVVLDAAVAEGPGMLHLGRAAVARLRAHLDTAWTCDQAPDGAGIPDPSLKSRRDELLGRLRALPNPVGLTARCVLMLTWQAVLGWGLFRALVLHDAAPAAAAAVPSGLFVLAAALTLWLAIRQWGDAQAAVDEARDAMMNAIAAKYEAMLRQDGLAVVRRVRRAIEERLETLEREMDAVERELTRLSKAAQGEAAAFDPPASAQVQPVVADAAGVQRVAGDLWGGRDLAPALAALWREAGLSGFRPLAALAHESTPVGEGADPRLARLAGAARAVLDDLRGGRHLERLDYHLVLQHPDPDECAAWLRAACERFHTEGSAVLWSRDGLRGAPRTWRVLPLGEEALAQAVRAAQPDRRAPELALPGLLGTLSEQEVAAGMPAADAPREAEP